LQQSGIGASQVRQPESSKYERKGSWITIIVGINPPTRNRVNSEKWAERPSPRRPASVAVSRSGGKSRTRRRSIPRTPPWISIPASVATSAEARTTAKTYSPLRSGVTASAVTLRSPRSR
jgi:hypothetical protein